MFHISQCNLGQTSKLNHTHPHRTKTCCWDSCICPKQPLNGFDFPVLLIILLLLERNPQSHNVQGFVPAKLGLHLVKQQKKPKTIKHTKKEEKVKTSRTKKEAEQSSKAPFNPGPSVLIVSLLFLSYILLYPWALLGLGDGVIGYLQPGASSG